MTARPADGILMLSMRANTTNPSDIAQERLLVSVAEQLKVPLTQIARRAELGESGVLAMDARAVRTEATAALALVDSYLLSLELLSSQQSLQLEPVSVSSLLTDVAHQLQPYAKHYGVALHMNLAGKYGPVMAHRAALKAALLSLGHTLVVAGGAKESPKDRQVILAGHKNAQGIAAGIYGNLDVEPADLRTALSLHKTARQPLVSLHDSGAGIFVADALAQAMESRLRIGRHNRYAGLAMTLLPSQQLQFI